MFAIAGKETYFTPVEVDVPDGSARGKKHKFEAEFRRLSQTELKEVFRRLDVKRLQDEEEILGDDELVQDVFVGWRGVNDMNGNPVEFSADAMAKLLDIYPVRPAVIGAFFNSIKTGARKN